MNETYSTATSEATSGKLSIALIRNGLTRRSWETPFLGLSEDPLAPEERRRLQERGEKGFYPQVQIVYTSEVVRCRETVRILYPSIPAVVVRELRAFDCGVMRGKKHSDLKKDEQFRTWSVLPDLMPLSDGESPHQFLVRSGLALQNIATEMSDKGIVKASVITHKAVIRTIVQRFCVPRFYYDDWALDGGGGYLLEFDIQTKSARIEKRL